MLTPVREQDHEALPSRILIRLAGVLAVGEAVVCRELKRPESVEVMDPGVVPLRSREVVHEEVNVVGDRARRVGVGVIRRWCDEVADRQEVMTR